MDDLIPGTMQLDEKCKELIKQAGKQYNIVALLFVTLTFTTLIVDIIRLIKYSSLDFDNWFDTFNFRIYPAILIVYVAVMYLQMYNYYKGIKSQTRAIENFDQDQLVKGFKYYIKGNRYSIIAMLIYIPMEIIAMYQEIFI